jgi:Ni,Fe-hydrogenase maturation factor
MSVVPLGEPHPFVIEPEPEGEEPVLDAHGMDPVKVLSLARELGEAPERVLVVGCEPELRMRGDEEQLVGELSAPVHAAVDGAVELVGSLLEELLSKLPTRKEDDTS